MISKIFVTIIDSLDSLLSMRLVLPIALHYSLYNKKTHIHKDKAYRLN